MAFFGWNRQISANFPHYVGTTEAADCEHVQPVGPAQDATTVMLSSYNQPLADTSLIACPDCDLLQRMPQLAPGGSARCPRCDTELWRRREDGLDRPLALALAAAVLYAVANSAPMLGLTVVGREAFTTVFGGAAQLWRDGREIVAGLVLFTAVVAPALQIGFMLVIALGARRAPVPRWMGTLLRHLPTTRTWSMIEVMMLGVLVALIKIAELATVIPGVAMFALLALIFVLAAMQASFDPRDVWNRIEWAADGTHPTAARDRWSEATS
jgi:paraquat-inducible protein A